MPSVVSVDARSEVTVRKLLVSSAAPSWMDDVEVNLTTSLVLSKLAATPVCVWMALRIEFKESVVASIVKGVPFTVNVPFVGVTPNLAADEAAG